MIFAILVILGAIVLAIVLAEEDSKCYLCFGESSF